MARNIVAPELEKKQPPHPFLAPPGAGRARDGWMDGCRCTCTWFGAWRAVARNNHCSCTPPSLSNHRAPVCFSGKYMLTWKPSVSNIQTVRLTTSEEIRTYYYTLQYNSTKTLIHYVDPSNETGDPDRSTSPNRPAKSGSGSILTLGENRNRYLAFSAGGEGELEEVDKKKTPHFDHVQVLIDMQPF